MSTAFEQKTDTGNPNADDNHSLGRPVDNIHNKQREAKIISPYESMPLYSGMPYGTSAGPNPSEYAAPPAYMAYSFQYNGNQGLGDGGMWGTQAAPNSQGVPPAAPDLYSMGYAQGQNEYYYPAQYNYNHYYNVDYAEMQPGNWSVANPHHAMGQVGGGKMGVGQTPASYYHHQGQPSAGASGGSNVRLHQPTHHLSPSQTHHMQQNYQTGQYAQVGVEAGSNGDDSIRTIESNFNKLNMDDSEDPVSSRSHNQLNKSSNHHNNDSSKSWATVASQQPKGSAATMVPPVAIKKGTACVSNNNTANSAPYMPSQSESPHTAPKIAPGKGMPSAGLSGNMGKGSGWASSAAHDQNRQGHFAQQSGRGGGHPNSGMWGGGGGGSWHSGSSGATSGGGSVLFNTGDSDMDARLSELQRKINPSQLNLDFDIARFFVIKSYSEDDIHRSIKYGIWCSTEPGNRKLNEAFNQMEKAGGKVYLFYSVNGSGHFCGVAEMISRVDTDAQAGVWCQSKWRGKFDVKWLYVKDVPNNHLRHIRLESNENKPVTNSRDATEVQPIEKGKQVLKLIHSFKHNTSIFDDFNHYEKREHETSNSRNH